MIQLASKALSARVAQFCHAIRRRLNMLYLVENNGAYGFTKGQFSATNDRRSKSRKGADNLFEAIDLAELAIGLGCGFVARSFSGDKAQIVPLIKAAMRYRGFALVDVISPCVTFNNHAASTKSYDYVREHNAALDRIDFVQGQAAISTDYEAGSSIDMTLHDGTMMRLHKLADDMTRATARPCCTGSKTSGRPARLRPGSCIWSPERRICTA